MSNIPKDVTSQASLDDIEIIKKELGQSEVKSDADSSTAKQAVEEAPSGASSETTNMKTPEKSQKSEETQTENITSEGEKTPSTEITPQTRQHRVSNSVPYDRFKEVNEALKKTQEELAQLRSNPLPASYNELEETGQSVPRLQDLVANEVSDKIQKVLEPIITSLDSDREKQEMQQALDKHPEAQKYLKEIKGYADATNLTYDDIVTLVLAKHTKSISEGEKQQAELEAQEAESSGQSNSTAKRKTISPTDITNLTDEELDSLMSKM